ncbi:MAG TPA: hypothetical protein VM364_14810 [Vicinamibacterales bacterium]|nr:hypothetical protein [Vicinamibacterales bacterium]
MDRLVDLALDPLAVRVVLAEPRRPVVADFACWRAGVFAVSQAQLWP